MNELPENYRRLQSALQPPILYADPAHERYHAQQAAPDIDTAAKRLARKSGLTTVKCACGAEFITTVSRRG